MAYGLPVVSSDLPSTRPFVPPDVGLLAGADDAAGHAAALLRLLGDPALAARLGAQALGLLFTAVLARALGEAGLGQFAFISAVLLIGNAVTTFGLDTLLIREVAGGGAPCFGTEKGGGATPPPNLFFFKYPRPPDPT